MRLVLPMIKTDRQSYINVYVIFAGICPALERHGKACHMLLSREDVHLIQTTLDADGMLICARWAIVSL